MYYTWVKHVESQAAPAKQTSEKYERVERQDDDEKKGKNVA